MIKTKFFTAMRVVTTALAACALAFASVACSDLAATEDATDTTQAAKPTLRIQVAAGARTVTPAMPELSELSDFVLYGAKRTNDYYYASAQNAPNCQTLASYATLADLQNAASVEFDVADVGSEWIFTLAAKQGTADFSCTTRTRLSVGENSVSFTLYRTSLGSGTGNFTLTVDYSAASNAASVTKAVASLRNAADDSAVSAVLDQTFGDGTQPLGGSVTFSKADVAAGAYTALITLYAGNAPLAQWYEIVQVADGATSSATRSLEKLNSVYRMTYVLNADGDDSVQFAGAETVTVATTALPEPTRSGYVFAGWYTDAALTSHFTLPATADTTLYARWESNDDPGIATSATVVEKIGAISATAESPATLQVFGSIDESTISTIRDALQNNENAYIMLDLSGTTGLETMPQGAFSYCNGLISISLPETITGIQYSAFYCCSSLVSVTIPKTVRYIYSEAFGNCTSLVSVTLPKAVSYIHSNAFSGCTALATIALDTGNTSYTVQDGVLYDASKTTLIVYPAGSANTNFTVPASVTSIESYAFNGCTGLSSIAIPDSVERIGYYAFSGCTNLASVSIGDGVTYIGESAFAGCTSLASFTVESGNTAYKAIDGVLYTADGTELVAYPAARAATSFEVPAAVTKIYREAFSGCTALTSITLASSDGEWYRLGSNESFWFDVWRGGQRIATEDVGSTILALPGYAYYNIPLTQLLADATEVSVYNTESLDVGDGTYTVASFAESSIQSYKVTVTAGNIYKINWCDSYNVRNGNYTNIPSNLSDNYIYVCDADGAQLAYTDDNTELSVTTTSSTLYIMLQARNASGTSAFRVYTAE